MDGKIGAMEIVLLLLIFVVPFLIVRTIKRLIKYWFEMKNKYKD